MAIAVDQDVKPQTKNILNLNMCGFSKELSQLDDSFEQKYPDLEVWIDI